MSDTTIDHLVMHSGPPVAAWVDGERHPVLAWGRMVVQHDYVMWVPMVLNTTAGTLVQADDLGPGTRITYDVPGAPRKPITVAELRERSGQANEGESEERSQGGQVYRDGEEDGEPV